MANITHGGHVGIVGVGQTNHARRRTDVSQAGLVREAVDRALADANLTMEDIDSVVVASGPVLFAAVNQPEKWVVNAIGAQNKPVVRVTSGGGAGFAGALAGYYQVAGGFAERTLVVAYDKLSEGQLQYSLKRGSVLSSFQHILKVSIRQAKQERLIHDDKLPYRAAATSQPTDRPTHV